MPEVKCLINIRIKPNNLIWLMTVGMFKKQQFRTVCTAAGNRKIDPVRVN
jgi:hypothetical protein